MSTVRADNLAPVRAGHLNIGSQPVPQDLFAFLPTHSWEVVGQELHHEALLDGQRVTVIASTFVSRYAGEFDGIGLLSTEVVANHRRVPVSETVSKLIDDAANEAVEANQDDLAAGHAELWGDR